MRWRLRVALVAGGVLGAFIVAELILLFLPVTELAPTRVVTPSDPIYRYESNRTFWWSRGTFFDRQRRVRTNNLGFVSSLDYEHQNGNKLAVIGDSYVQALHVEDSESFVTHLRSTLEGCVSVDGLGFSGAPLSQYVAYAEYAVNELGADRLLFLVTHNDFYESWRRSGLLPGMHQFVRQSSGDVTLELTPSQPSRLLRRIASGSRLVRYLHQHTNVVNALLGERAGYVTEQAAQAESDVEDQARQAVRLFFGELERRLPSVQEIVFVTDADRPALYGEEMSSARALGARMKEVLLSEASGRGFEAVDLEAPFLEEFRRSGRRFETPLDNHWNAHGHRTAAHVIARSQTVRALLQSCTKTHTRRPM